MKDYGARKVAVGDAAKGKAVFEGGGGCLSCHRVNHVGSHLAPDLSEIGAARSAAMLEDTLLDPVSNARPGNRSIRAVKKTGEVVTGRRLNEDTWSVQIIDSQREAGLAVEAGSQGIHGHQVDDAVVQRQAHGR